MQISNHTDLLNYLVHRYGLKTYCEIGIQDPSKNFNKIKCDTDCKKGVDPEYMGNDVTIAKLTSDMFFNQWLGEKIDLIFIDGLHTSDQVRRDFENSLKCLNTGGFIVLHDTCPEIESTTLVPRNSRVWHGDVYRFAMSLHLYTGTNFVTFDIDCGITVVWKQWPDIKMPTHELTRTWKSYTEYKQSSLNIIDISRIEEIDSCIQVAIERGA